MPWQYPTLGYAKDMAFRTLFNDFLRTLLSSSSGKVLGMSKEI